MEENSSLYTYRLRALFRHAILCASLDDEPFAKVIFEPGHADEALKARDFSRNLARLRSDRVVPRTLDAPDESYFSPEDSRALVAFPGIFIAKNSTAYDYLQSLKEPEYLHYTRKATLRHIETSDTDGFVTQVYDALGHYVQEQKLKLHMVQSN